MTRCIHSYWTPVVICLLAWSLVPAAVEAQEPATPAAESAPGPAPAPESLVAARQAQLLGRLRQELDAPVNGENEQAAQRRLDQIVADGDQLVSITTSDRLKYDCLSIQLQALNARLTRWPVEIGNDRRLVELRDAARKMKALKQPNALAVGDFWLTAAELFEIKQSDLPLHDKQRQSEQVLRSFIVVHNNGPIVDAARAALKKLMDQAGAGGAGVPTAELDPNAQAPAPESSADPIYSLGERTVGADGVVRVPIRSRYQRTENVLRVLAPHGRAEVKPEQIVSFLLVLPVETGESGEFGDPIAAIRELDLHNRYNLVVVSPTLSDTPWYADHPTDLKLRQASYITRAVVPAMKEIYPAGAGGAKVLLLGFSRSGWGAMSLLCRYPREFEAVAIWDAPLLIDSPDRPGLDRLVGNADQFARYALANQLRDSARYFKKDKKIALLGYDFFMDDMQRAHQLLDELGVPHDYLEQPGRRHRWDSGWVPEAVQKLVAMAG